MTTLVCVVLLVVQRILWAEGNSQESVPRPRNDDTPLESLTILLTQHSQVIQQLQADISALKAESHQQNTTISSLNAKLADAVTPVVFSAYARTGTFVQGQTVTFNRIIYDTANMYDHLTGIIVIPLTGTYFVYIRADPPAEFLWIDFKVNSAIKITAYAESASASGAITLRLNHGDRVWASISADRHTGTHIEEATMMTLVRLTP